MPTLDEAEITAIMEEDFFTVEVTWDDYGGDGSKQLKVYFGATSGGQSGSPVWTA